ncbi:MAG: UDP binding domain-containing protein [Pseudomonadota bacterium]
MRIVLHGNTLFAWTAATQLAALGHSVTLCPAWSVLITRPDDEVAREFGLTDSLSDQILAQRLSFASGIDFLSPDKPVVDQHLLALDGSVRRLQDQCEALVCAACLRADGEPVPAFGVLTAFPAGTLRKLSDYLQQVFDYQCRQAIADQRILPSRGPLTFALPLFVRAGSALADFTAPPLLLIGCNEESARTLLFEALRPVVRNAREVMWVSLDAAELIKSAVNAMLATRVSFMNELASLCEHLRVDVDVVRQGMAADPRIGRAYLEPGCGFGGPSFSGEVINFSQTLQQSLGHSTLIGTVMDINTRQREELFRKVWRYFRGDLRGRCFVVWGAAYKPGSASVQESAVHPLLQALWAQGARTVVYDPLAGQSLAEHYTDQPLLLVANTLAESLEGGTEHALEAVIVVTACDEFKSPDYRLLHQRLKAPVIFDGRNIYDPDFMRQSGFVYVGIGRGDSV